MSAPYQWRADSGYRQASPPASFLFYPPPAPMFFPPVQYVPGPVGVYGIQQQPLQHVVAASTNSSPPSPPKKAEKAKEEEKAEKKEDKKPEKREEKKDAKKDEKKEEKPKPKPKPLPMGPPSLAPGVNYLFPASHVYMHVFQKAVKIWEPKYQGRRDLGFKIFKVSTDAPVSAFIERALGISSVEFPEKYKGCKMTELIEGGDGVWHEGSTIAFDSPKASGSLASMGWTGKRGKDMPPVWVSIYWD